MKKVLFLAVIAIALMCGTTSCAKKKRCFKTTIVYVYEGETYTKVKYSWADVGTGLCEQFAESLMSAFSGIKITKNESVEVHEYKTSQDCLGQNNGENYIDDIS